MTAHIAPSHSDAIILLWSITSDLEELIRLSVDAPYATRARLMIAYNNIVSIVNPAADNDTALASYDATTDPDFPAIFWNTVAKKEALGNEPH